MYGYHYFILLLKSNSNFLMYEKICMGARLSLSYGADAETTNNKLTVAIDFFYHVIKNAI